MAATNGTNGSKPTTAQAAYGNRLLPHIVDDKAISHPNDEAFSIPRSSDPADGWKSVTWKQYANAVNHIASRIIETIGPAPLGAFPTIAYLGPNDARYIVLVLAAVKAGYKAFFISPRNSHEGQMSLFEHTDCHYLSFPATHRALVQPWLQARPEMKGIEVGALENWFPDHDVAVFPYDKTFEEARFEPLVVLHTSGSTGIPKPIVCKNGMLSIGDAFQALPEWEGYEVWIKEWSTRGKKHFLPMPLFHAAGLYLSLIGIVYCSLPTAFPISDKPLSTALVVDCLKYSGAEGTVLPPALLEDMSQDDEQVAALAKMQLVGFGGGNLAREAGNRLVQNGVQLMNMISATEFAPFPLYFQKNLDNWQYFIINDELFGCDWRRSGGEDDSVYRQVIVRQDPKDPGYQGFFVTFPDIHEYDTKDLYRPHPTLKHHWIYHGRSDDVIVFSNGEKLNPTTIENLVTDHPKIEGAVVVGANRFQPALFLEPGPGFHPGPDNAQGADALIDEVWPLVVAANKETVAHGQIGRSFIRLTDPTKPFPRAGKGTIQRAMAVKQYAPEIDSLYESAGSATVDAASAPRIDVSSPETLVLSIERLFEEKLGSGKLEPEADFFSVGIDSMQVINASRLLRAGLEAAGFHTDATALATRVIYANPTPVRLAQYIYSAIVKRDGEAGAAAGHDQRAANAGQDEEDEHEIQAMKYLWDKYTQDLASEPATAAAARPEPRSEKQTVILTGSTGMLGSYMLDKLARDPSVRRIVCLNRPDDGGAARQVKNMASRGLVGPDVYKSKTEFYHADMSRADFGLSPEVLADLSADADRFVHNAWPVNFNMPVESFEPFLRGVRNVGDFATAASRKVAVVFISSIGTADKWNAVPAEDGKPRGKVPEASLEDLRLAGGGYGRSKMVGSLILEASARAGGFPAAVMRMGQIAGPAESELGQWNRQEWLPSIVASSVFLGALPGSLAMMDRVDWTPCETEASLVLEVVGAVGGSPNNRDSSGVSGYYHGTNPESTTWSGSLVGAIQDFYGRDKIPRVTATFDEWVDLLEESTAQMEGNAMWLERNPGVKLIDTYRAMASAPAEAATVYDMARTVSRSPAMAAAKAVTPELMKLWCKQWAYA